MKKRYISANELLIDAYKLAKVIHQDGFFPDYIVGVWRGGTPIAIAMQEYFAYQGIENQHSAIKTSAYSGINAPNKKVIVSGMEELLSDIHNVKRLLIVDDVFDSGRSVTAILTELRKSAGEHYPETILTAFPWYKPERNTTDIAPDYYLHTTDDWLVFPHELLQLTPDEIRQGKGDAIANILF